MTNTLKLIKSIVKYLSNINHSFYYTGQTLGIVCLNINALLSMCLLVDTGVQQITTWKILIQA